MISVTNKRKKATPGIKIKQKKEPAPVSQDTSPYTGQSQEADLSQSVRRDPIMMQNSLLASAKKTTGTKTADATRIAALQQLYAQQRAEAQNRLNQTMASLVQSYQEGETRLKNRLDALLSQLKTQHEQADRATQQQYDRSSGALNTSVDRALADAYASKMAAQRNIEQLLASQGMTGGMSESTLLNLANQYGRNRSELENERQSGITELLSQLQKQKDVNRNGYVSGATQARQSYESQYEQLRQQMLAQQLAQQKEYDRLIQSLNQQETSAFS